MLDKPNVNAPIHNIAFLLVPRFSMIAFTSAVEPLRMANQLTGQTLYRWSVLTLDGQPVPASNGMSIIPDGALSDSGDWSLVMVCGGMDINQAADKNLLFQLRKLANRKIPLGALCTGSYLLAKAELLNGYRCTIHWENMASLREEFPGLIISSELFEIDRDRYTCSGGTAPLDMMLHLIGRQQGADLAAAISEEFICERIRDRHDRQRVPLRLRLGTSQPKLIEAVSLMEANLEEPMSPDELARHVGLSRRQLERLFQKYLNCVPTRYYLELRLARARQLLLQTTMSIVDVAFACGFVSAPHFSKCYRDFFGIPPRDERRLRRAEAPAAAPRARTA
ncbi:MAG TPA: GlxA family transcriptional regulator [Candidatus Competibacteraceae bacterium]|nr:GlxA family transcriptional regulator [Candidatus Competibacteraceae bacterium]